MAEGIAIPANYEFETRDIEYQSGESGPLLARLYRPIGPGPFPGIVEVHGGAWTMNDRLANAVLAEALAKSGILVLSIDFRMPPQAGYPASIADVNLATRWLKHHAEELGTHPEMVGGLGTSSGAHQLLLSLLRPHDRRYAGLKLPEDGQRDGHDASLPFVVLCWPIADPLARYRMAREKGAQNLIKAHEAYWPDEAAMAEGSPQAILESGTVHSLPPALILQGTKDDNVTPDMADRLAAAWRHCSGEVEIEKYEGMPHTFIMRDPAADASRRATERIRDFILTQAAAIEDIEG